MSCFTVAFQYSIAHPLHQFSGHCLWLKKNQLHSSYGLHGWTSICPHNEHVHIGSHGLQHFYWLVFFCFCMKCSAFSLVHACWMYVIRAITKNSGKKLWGVSQNLMLTASHFRHPKLNQLTYQY